MADQVAVFVDIPNLYSSLLRQQANFVREARDYFLYWFDFDRLAENLSGINCDVWAFYSGERFGPSGNRIASQYLLDFIDRINSQRGVTARDVNIPGYQREPTHYECERCGHEGIGQWQSEKGIDSSLTVHLFETMDAWDAAFLVSGDADYVPVVSSLRKRGKIIVGAGFPDASSALVRECYDYMELDQNFFQGDLAARNLFSKNGLAESWLLPEPNAVSATDASHQKISLSFSFEEEEGGNIHRYHRLLSSDEYEEEGMFCLLYLLADGPIQLDDRLSQIEEFSTRFPIVTMDARRGRASAKFLLSPTAWSGAKLRLDEFKSRNIDLVANQRTPSDYFTAEYEFDPATGEYSGIASQ